MNGDYLVRRLWKVNIFDETRLGIKSVVQWKDTYVKKIVNKNKLDS